MTLVSSAWDLATSDQAFDDLRPNRIVHRLHSLAHGLRIVGKGGLLLRVEPEFGGHILESLFRADRWRRGVNADPQGADDEEQIERQRQRQQRLQQMKSGSAAGGRLDDSHVC